LSKYKGSYIIFIAIEEEENYDETFRKWNKEGLIIADY